MKGQIGLFEYLNTANKPTPQLADGDTVYILSLDVVERGKIKRSFICGEQSENPYFGYNVKLDDGHTTVWDYLMGERVFKCEQDARRKVDSLCFEKIRPCELDFVECKSFSYIRGLDGHELTATIGKVGERQLYEHKFICYHFLKEYACTEERDAAYSKMFAELSEEAEHSNAKELIPPALDVLYKVNAELYASRGYAEHNGVFRAIAEVENENRVI